MPVIRRFAGDLGHGLRLLAGRPGFAAVAILTLALGIGANTAIFSVVNALLLAPLPFHDPDRLVMVWESEAGSPRSTFIVSAPNWQDWRAQSTTLKDFAIWEFLSFNLGGSGADPEQISGLRVSASAFDLLGVRPQLGRTFTPAEDEPGHRVVVISDALWTRRFGRDPGIIGRQIRLNGESHEVIGVMPASFRFVQGRQAVWVPIQFTWQDRGRNAHSFYAAARLGEGVSLEAARTELAAIARRVTEGQQDDTGNHWATITPMADLGIAPLRPTLVALLGAVALVLLIACVNVANLMLVQAAARQREFAIRAAVGASRARIAAQLLTEGLLLAGLGGAAGVLLAWVGTRGMSGSLPAAIQFAPFRNAGDVPLDGRVLAFTSIVVLLTGLLFSLAPMFGAARTQPGIALKAAGDRGTGRLAWMRHGLVAAELALAVIVLFGAGLMIKSVARLVSVDPGLDPGRVLVMDIALPQPDTYGAPVRTTFCDDVQREIGSLPGVRAVGATSHLPLSGANAGRGLTIEGRPVPPPDQAVSANYRLTCPGYFAALGIPLVRGRDFSAADTLASPGVVIINEEMARRYFEGQDPLGQRIKLGPAGSSNPWMTVVGIARDVRHFGLDSPIRREIFRPYSQAVWPSMTITVKAAAEPLNLAAPVRAALARIDPEQPVSRVRTMEDVVAESIGGRRFPMLLLAIFSAVALALAAIGVYGVVSYLVSQRTRELGIRVALGARRPQVMQLVVGGSLRPIAAGLAAGVAGAMAAARLLSTLLYAVAPWDPAVMSGIVGILGVTAAVACWLPARRAATIDPLVALRDS